MSRTSMGLDGRLAVLLPVLLAACSDSPQGACGSKLPDGSCVGVSQPEICGDTYCTAGASCARILYVKQDSTVGDGSTERPYGTLHDAAANASSGDCIALAAGRYGATTLGGGVSILGKGADATTVESPDDRVPALYVENGSGGIIRGVNLRGEGRGLSLRNVKSLRIEQVRVDAARTVGIEAWSSSGLTIRDCHLKGIRELVSPPKPDASPPPDSGTKPDAQPQADSGSKPDTGHPDQGTNADAELRDGANEAPRPDARPPDRSHDRASPDAAPPPQLRSNYGIGLLLAQGTTASISRLLVEDSAAQGVFVNESGLTLHSSAVLRSGAHGLAIDCSVDKRCESVELASTIAGSSVQESGAVGLWIRGGNQVVRDCDVGYTKVRFAVARGVEIQGGAQVELSNNTVHHGKGQGIVIDGSTGKLNGNRVTDNEERGLWVQRVSSSLVLEDNEAIGNRMAGIGFTGCSGVQVLGGRVAGTRKMAVLVETKSAMVADGLQVLGASTVSVSRLAVDGNERVGVLVDGSTASVSQATIGGGEAALVVQNAKLTDQTLTDNRDLAGAAVVPSVPTVTYLVRTTPVDLVGVLPVPIP